MGRVPCFEDDSGFVHMHIPAHGKFTQHSNETFFAMVDDLETFEGPPGTDQEKVYGLNYEPTELLWCRDVRRHLRFPAVVYWDHMHCCTASGGIAQYLVNQMVPRFCATLGMQPSDWDTFHRQLEGIPRERKDLFPDSHCRR